MKLDKSIKSDRSDKYDAIIENIRQIIKAKNLKQREVAAKAGMTPQELSNILNEHRKLLRVEQVPSIAQALEVEIESVFFFGRENEDSENNKHNDDHYHCITSMPDNEHAYNC